MAMPELPPVPPVRSAPASAAHLFFAFTRMALQGFGGVLAVAQQELVERQRWLERSEFVELLSLAQVLPGPNVVNLSLMVGDRFFGWRGALAALAGMLVLPTLIVLALAALYSGFADEPRVAGALRGMGAVAAGLVLATALKLLPTLQSNPMGRGVCATAMVLTVLVSVVLHWPLVWLVGGLGSLCVAFAWWRLGTR